MSAQGEAMEPIQDGPNTPTAYKRWRWKIVAGIFSAILLGLVILLILVYLQLQKTSAQVILITGGYMTSTSVEVFDPLGRCNVNFMDEKVQYPTFWNQLMHTVCGKEFKITGGSDPKPNQAGRYWHSSHYLHTGQVLLCGGGGGYHGITCDELKNNKFQHHSNLTTMYRAGHSGVVVGGKLWLMGGRKQVSLTSMETLAVGGKEWKPLGYNSPWKEISPGTEQWNNTILTCKKTISQVEYNSYSKPYFRGLQEGCAVLTPNNKIIIIGGKEASHGQSSGYNHGIDQEVMEFNPRSKNWKKLAPMLGGGRFGHSCVLIPGGGGKILVAGGSTNSINSVLNTSQIYDISANSWKMAASMNQERVYGEMVRANGRIFFLGGTAIAPTMFFFHTWKDETPSKNSIEEYNPDTDTWTLLKSTLNKPRVKFGAVAVPRSTMGCK